MDSKLYINTSDNEVRFSKNSIFLAGPTQRDSTFETSWRKEAIEILKQLDFNGVVYVPEFLEDVSFTDDFLKNQINWEWQALDNAGIIVFWIPREKEKLPGFATNVEFGRYVTLKPDKVVLGYPETACEIEYLKLLYKKEANKDPKHTLIETLISAVDMLNSN